MTESVHVGDRVSRKIEIGKDERSTKLFKGTVIYVHPEGRFHTVKFGNPPYTFKESFPGDGTHRRQAL